MSPTCFSVSTLASDVLAYATAATGLPKAEARRAVRRLLFGKGLQGLIQDAPQELLDRVAATERPECLELILLQTLRAA